MIRDRRELFQQAAVVVGKSTDRLDQIRSVAQRAMKALRPSLPERKLQRLEDLDQQVDLRIALVLLAVERLCERLRREVAQFYGIPATDMRPPPLKRMRGVVMPASAWRIILALMPHSPISS